MDIITGKSFDAERAFYGRSGVRVARCAFDGPADGESAFKECSDIQAEHCFSTSATPSGTTTGSGYTTAS